MWIKEHLDREVAAMIREKKSGVHTQSWHLCMCRTCIHTSGNSLLNYYELCKGFKKSCKTLKLLFCLFYWRGKLVPLCLTPLKSSMWCCLTRPWRKSCFRESCMFHYGPFASGWSVCLFLCSHPISSRLFSSLSWHNTTWMAEACWLAGGVGTPPHPVKVTSLLYC